MGEQRFAEAARAGLSGSEISTLFGGELKKPGAVWSAGAVPAVVMHRSNNT
jgi:hypothetical protein